MAAVSAQHATQQGTRTMVSLGSATAGAGASFLFGLLIGHARGWRAATDAIEARRAAEHRAALFRQHKNQMDHQAALDRLAASQARAADAINADVNDRLMEYLYSSKYRSLQDGMERALADHDSSAARDTDRWAKGKGFPQDDFFQSRDGGASDRRFDADKWGNGDGNGRGGGRRD